MARSKPLHGLVELEIIKMVVGLDDQRVFLSRGRPHQRGQRQDQSTHNFMVAHPVAQPIQAAMPAFSRAFLLPLSAAA